jgi:hypothetical protein
MRRIFVATLIVGLAACGGSEGDGGSPGASAPAGGTGAAEATAQTHPDVESCLDLVSQAKFSEAVTVCARAATLDPDNQEVRDALATARREAAAMAASAAKTAGEAAQGAEAAADEAAEGAKDAADAMGKQMP